VLMPRAGMLRMTRFLMVMSSMFWFQALKAPWVWSVVDQPVPSKTAPDLPVKLSPDFGVIEPVSLKVPMPRQKLVPAGWSFTAFWISDPAEMLTAPVGHAMVDCGPGTRLPLPAGGSDDPLGLCEGLGLGDGLGLCRGLGLDDELGLCDGLGPGDGPGLAPEQSGFWALQGAWNFSFAPFPWLPTAPEACARSMKPVAIDRTIHAAGTLEDETLMTASAPPRRPWPSPFHRPLEGQSLSRNHHQR